MQIYKLVCLALPIGLYFTIKRYYLHSGELWLLLYANLLILSTIVDDWIMQITHLVIVTALSMHVLSISKEINGSLSEKKYHPFVKVFFHLEEQLSIIVYVIAAWLFLRVFTSKSLQYGQGVEYQEGKLFHGVNKTLHGWNCTQLEFVIIPFIWVVVNLLSYCIAKDIIRTQSDKDNLYKEYVVKYLVVPFIACSLVVFGFNMMSYLDAERLFQCAYYWEQSYTGMIMKAAVYVGYGLSVIYFFYVKKGVFLVEGEGEENTSDKADNNQ